MTVDAYKVSFCGDEYVLKLIVSTVVNSRYSKKPLACILYMGEFTLCVNKAVIKIYMCNLCKKHP